MILAGGTGTVFVSYSTYLCCTLVVDEGGALILIMLPSVLQLEGLVAFSITDRLFALDDKVI